jgi:apolipoprotein D and lipocalin family protein
MKTICTILTFVWALFAGNINKPVEQHVDLERFAGKWYSLYSIPTMFDKGSRETNTTYTLNKDGYYNVVTCAKKADDNEIRTVKSKLFPVEGTNNAQMKVQFIWPYKVDYWIIELAPDYSYVVVGHPDRKFLFIMSRKPCIDKKLYQDIVARCKARGYETEKLTAQYNAALSE